MPEQWKNKEIIKHPNRNILNSIIREKILEIEQGNLIKKEHDFYAYCEKKIAQQKSKDSFGTWKHKKSYLSKMRKFKPHLQFSHLTPSFMLDFENYCRGQGNKPTTVWSSVKFIKTMVNAALNDGVITVNPMRGYKASPYVNPEREYLTAEEIERMEKFAEESKNETLVKVANWYLFSVYSGLRYSDVKKFDKKKIIEGRIFLRTLKSSTDVSIKLHPKLSAILEKISTDVFTNQKMNDYLKVIAEKCGIDKNISFHSARHSAAVYFLNHGGSMEALSKLLGHKSMRVTSVYGKITDKRLDDEITKVWG